MDTDALQDLEGTSSCEPILFAEKNDANRCIAVFGINISDDDVVDDNEISGKNFDATACYEALRELRKILDKYMECPSLLDQSMEFMVTSISGMAITILLRTNNESNLLDHAFLHTPLPCLLSSLYALSKVRGRKFVQRFLPHEVDHVIPILVALEHVDKLQQQQQQQQQCDNNNNNDNEVASSEHTPTWESIYSLWNWMGMLSLVPFGLCALADSESTIVSRLVTLARRHLSQSGSHRETAAACLASWLSRPDLKVALNEFMDWAKEVLDAFHQQQQQSKFQNGVLVLGVIRTVVTILKIARCDNDQLEYIMERLWEPMTRITDMKTNSNIVMRKLTAKWWARMACANLPPRVARWRYQRGRRSLLENLTQTTATTTESTGTSDAENKKELASNYTMENNYEQVDDDFFVIPDEVEVAMGHLIEAITDSSTIVRWSAAKGVGRLTERLPSLCALDVVDAVLALCQDVDKDHAWHGACLTLAELARRGLLLPSQLESVVPLIVKAIQYDMQRGNTSVGSAVRDAACYTYWAFARAYSPDVLRPFIQELSQSVVVTSLFDREVNCRRAASAAFQECVGRQGANNFKHGIEILTLADYFSLGNRTNAYTSIAFQVAQYDEYRHPIIEHLYKAKLRHWDVNIRILTSTALRFLAPVDVQFFCSVVIPSLLVSSLDQTLAVRHGAVLGLAEILLAVGQESHDKHVALVTFLGDGCCCSMAELVPSIEQRRLYRGRGGEIMRSAVCRLIQCLSLAKLPLTVKQQVRLLDSVDACLPHPSENIQKAASEALQALMCSYFPVGPKGPSDRLQKRVVDKYVQSLTTEDNPAATRGFALALGSLPRKLLAPSHAVLDSVINSLCLASRSNAVVGQHKDGDTRRNAIISLTRICQVVGVHPVSSESTVDVYLTCDQLSRVFDAFFTALDDYNTDRRGDVGSWSRVAAMHGLEQVTSLVATSSDPSTRLLLDESFCVRLIGSLLKQLAEKLDSVRNEAGQCLARILTTSDHPIPLITHKEGLLHALLLSGVNESPNLSWNWSDSTITFPMVMDAAQIDEYFDYVVAGIIVSVGGLTEAVTKHSSKAFLEYAKDLNQEGQVDRLGFALLKLFEQHQFDSRVILPLLKTFDLLISHRCLDTLIASNSDFGLSLFSFLKLEEARSGDVQQLFAIARVLFGLLAISRSGELDQAICLLTCKMLSHRFPRVRQYIAENFYMQVIERPDLVGCDMQAFDKVLLQAPWHADLNLSQRCDMATKVSASLGLTLPFDHAVESQPVIKKEMTDEFASYAALALNHDL